MVIALLGVGVDAASIGGAIVGFTIYGVILWYLCRLNVRSYFWQGKNPSTLKIMQSVLLVTTRSRLYY